MDVESVSSRLAVPSSFVAVEKREQVFVSSTYLDLTEERQEVIQTLLEADCIPAGMELFPASDDEKWALIKRVIDDCDYYVLVIGGRYGSVDPEKGISFTEMEFDYAVSIGKPVMAFLHGSPGSIPGDKLELNEHAQAKLAAFRAKAEQRVVKYWNSPTELSGQVAKSLIQTRKSHPAEGWVRARDAVTPEVEREIAEMRAKIAELTNELGGVRKADVEDVPVDIAGGGDRHAVKAWLQYWSKEDMAKAEYLRKAKSWSVDLVTTWDGIFRNLGPLMMDDSPEPALQKELDELTLELLSTQPDRPDDLGTPRTLTADKSSFQDVIVQFFALGLIQQSSRRRAVADRDTYWTLTDRGRAHLMLLRAIRRPIEDADT